ncbi:M14 family metallopeptidase [Pedobacter cryoconitis]|uniref:Zinc carboxypeptidase n=1 Tax=Pedobacter cryoconitis TaxID=188932 RepID=A0A327T151_9SPHI|nr:M14 family metallopeptidase [Pedobacter cryoconitis]RAJ34185.1 zinc carboxypeptidase [Pedobacter cryoconitis]
MKYFLLSLILLTMETFAQQTPYELSNKNQTATYDQAIAYYKQLAKVSPQARLLSYGTTDFGKPLHLLVLSKNKVFDPAELRKNNQRILLINNGIHPGEPEGIDASMMLARDLLKDNHLPDNVVICIIPVYNIDGSFNRSSTSRANQNGPETYGFRGNSKNYDLNRDFIKTDSKNSAAFQEIFNTWQPEIFVDTHTSNGADYQYTMTLIPTQKDKLNPILAEYLTKSMVPALYAAMKKKGFELIPYINSVENTPDAGITGFLETPRYSTGYAALHNSIGFMPETHMLKVYQKRVESTYQLLQTYVDLVSKDAKIIGENKRKADEAAAIQKEFPLSWKLNETTYELISFKGFAAKYKPSAVSGADRLYYDRNDPYTKKIKYWNKFEPQLTVEKPEAYVIPKAWDKVIGLLKLNGVKVQELKADKELAVDVYYIEDYKTASRPYEGHYIHNNVQLSTKKQTIKFYKGDYLVYVNQPQNRYIMETLEPQATDSFFNWNFFDSVLDQKEHYSAYVFEDTATGLLKDDPELKTKLNQKKIKDSTFAQNPSAQLEFVYQNSNYYEKTHLRYPIARLH